MVSLGMMGVDLTVLGITRKSEAEADQLGTLIDSFIAIAFTANVIIESEIG